MGDCALKVFPERTSGYVSFKMCLETYTYNHFKSFASKRNGVEKMISKKEIDEIKAMSNEEFKRWVEEKLADKDHITQLEDLYFDENFNDTEKRYILLTYEAKREDALYKSFWDYLIDNYGLIKLFEKYLTVLNFSRTEGTSMKELEKWEIYLSQKREMGMTKLKEIIERGGSMAGKIEAAKALKENWGMERLGQVLNSIAPPIARYIHEAIDDKNMEKKAKEVTKQMEKKGAKKDKKESIWKKVLKIGVRELFSKGRRKK